MGLKVVFFGTPEIAAIILEELVKRKIEIIAVVTRPDKVGGRHLKIQKHPVKQVAEDLQLPLYQPEKVGSVEFLEKLKEMNPDLFIVAAYSEIFKDNFLSIPRLGCINVHPSLLPKYRGAAPMERAIMAGESATGVTIMAMNPRIDAGNILAVGKIDIDEEMTGGELAKKLAYLGSELLCSVIGAIERGECPSIVQNDLEASPAPKIKAEEERIDWKKSARELHNQIRALSPKPGVWTQILLRGNQRRLLIKKAKSEPLLSGLPGEILSENGLVVGTGSGALRLLEVQLDGKKAMSVTDFLRGIAKEEIIFE